MLNKLKFNNLVITNKKKIQQIKAQTINKLVQKLRKLKTLLEKKPDERNKERLRKCQETIAQLKQLKKIDLIKRVLLLGKNPTAVLTNGRSTPDEVAVAMLAQNKIMQQLTKCFREELNLSEVDQSWKNDLLEASKRRSKIKRTEEKRLKRTQIKEQKAVERKRTEWLQENVSQRAMDVNKTSDNDEAINISSSGGWRIDVVDPEPNQKDKEKPGELSVDTDLKRPNHKKESYSIAEKKKKTQSQESLVESRVIPGKHSKPVEPISQKAMNINLETGKDQSLEVPIIVTDKRCKVDVSKKKSIINTERPKKAQSDTNQDKPRVKQDIESGANEDMSEQITHVVDPFFITDTGENYLSTAVIRRGETDAHTMPFAGEGRAKRREEARRKANGYKEQPRSNNDRNNYKQRQKSQQPNKVAAAPALNLHPSWAAKQKQKPVISSFQGKKISFDDDGGKNPAIMAQGKNSRNQNAGDKRHNKEPEAIQRSETMNLHPSWAAKQKQKPAITAFEGKKITFDNID